MFPMLTIIYVLWLILIDSSYGQAQNEYDVIIMGAGSSGIAAAKTLYEANITNILIIEAMDYIGGRAKVMNLSNYMFNIGASWISGACINHSNCSSDYNEINPMLTAAYKYNISFIVNAWSTWNEIILDFGGNQHNVTNSNNILNKFYQAQDCVDNIPYDNAYDNDMSYFAALNLCGWKPPYQAIEKTISLDEGQETKWRTAFAYKPYRTTFNSFGPDEAFITDPRGYQGIIEALANEFLDINDEDKIIFNSPINTIEYDENSVIVTLDNSTKYSAKYGIVTFSLGVLQSDIIEFVPKLPSWKIDSFLAFDIIDYAPILVKWPYDFWSDTIGDTEFIHLNDDRYGFFIWIYNFDRVFNGSLIWRFNIKLDLAQMVQYQNINDTIRLIIDLKLSHYFDAIPYPDDIIIADWNSNKYFQGSWSSWPVGINYEIKERMGWPLLQRLFFAGEHNSDFDYGYVHTAWFSGNDTANKILSCIGYDNGFNCPSQYIPSIPSDDCKSDQSVFKDLIWLWVILSILFGIILGYLFAKYYTKNLNVQNKSDGNYGSVDNMRVPMVTQNTD